MYIRQVHKDCIFNGVAVALFTHYAYEKCSLKRSYRILARLRRWPKKLQGFYGRVVLLISDKVLSFLCHQITFFWTVWKQHSHLLKFSLVTCGQNTSFDDSKMVVIYLTYFWFLWIVHGKSALKYPQCPFFIEMSLEKTVISQRKTANDFVCLESLRIMETVLFLISQIFNCFTVSMSYSTEI